MKLKPIAAVMPVMFALLTGCNNMDSSTTDRHFPWILPAHHHHHMQAMTNGDIIEDCIKINEAEIRVATLAKSRTTCPAIRHFAAKMIHDHHQNLREVRRVSHETGIAPTMNSEAARIEEKSAHKLAKLKMLHGRDFNREFAQGMVHCHHRALKLLDHAIHDSTNPKLTAYLKATHAAVTKHLHEAEALLMKCGL
jgi:predicted outer membrane protein